MHDAWSTHRRLLLTNAGYAAALAATVAALATRTTLTDLLSAAVAGALALRNALHDTEPHNTRQLPQQ